MDKLDSAVTTFDNTVKGWLSFIDNNEYVTAVLTLFLILYASFAAPKLPMYILKLFDNPFVKLLIFFLIVYIARKNPTVAIIAAVALMVSIHALNKLKLDQSMMMLACKQKEHMNAQENKRESVQESTSEFVLEDISRPEFLMPETSGIQNEMKMQPEQAQQPECGKRANFRNSFYPQYVNMKPDAYKSRYNGHDVNGFDSQAAYASI